MRRLPAVFIAAVLLIAGACVLPVRAAAPIEAVTSQDFAQKVLQSPVPVVVQFDAKWCPYCRKVRPLMEDLAADKAGKVAVYRVDIDAEFGLAQLFGVRSLPTIVLLKKGLEAGRIEGVPSKAKLYLFADK